MPTAELDPLAPAKPRRPAGRSAVARVATSDAALVQRMRDGDEGSFERIFKRHHAPLLSYCRHMLASRDEAEDALQQTFIRAHRALLGGSPPRELRPWLYAIARNCCLSAIAARHPTSELDERAPSLGGLSQAVHEREELRELVTDIARLPEDQRSALLLAELDDLSHRAIATVVGCPVSKVKALVYQARSTLLAERDARDASCRDIREELSVARGGELRRGPLRRHLRLCSGCRDFQLAIETQRQSLAIVLPVLPSAALAARVLGHGALHAMGATAAGHTAAGQAGAASVGQAGAGIVPLGGGAVAGTGTAASSGGVIATASGTAAGATATAGATAVSGGSAGAWIGGGLLAKVAVGGTVAALATAGAVAIPHRLWRPARPISQVALHSGTPPASSLLARENGSGAPSTELISTSEPSPVGAVAQESHLGDFQPGLSGLISPASDLTAASTGALLLPPGSSPSPLTGISGVAAPPAGAVVATARQRALAHHARLRALRHRRQLLGHRRMLKRRLQLKKRRLRKKRHHRERISAVAPPAVAPTAATPTRKPARRKQAKTGASPASSTAPAARGETTVRRKARGAQSSEGVSPASAGTTRAPRKTGKGSTTGGASGASTGAPESSAGAGAGDPGSGKTAGGAAGKAGGAGGQTTGGKSSGAETGGPPSGGKSRGAGGKGAGGAASGSEAGSSTVGSGASSSGARDPEGKPSSPNIGLPEENILDASRTSGQPLG